MIKILVNLKVGSYLCYIKIDRNMKTILPTQIETIEQAKEFLKALCDNNEAFHPEDDAHDALSNTGWTYEECDQLNKLMEDIYALPGSFDPCEFILSLDPDYVRD